MNFISNFFLPRLALLQYYNESSRIENSKDIIARRREEWSVLSSLRNEKSARARWIKGEAETRLPFAKIEYHSQP